MVQRLSVALDLPLRETNRLLTDAGLAPAYPETRLDDPDLGAFSDAIEQMLARHEPYPAYVIDRHWDIVRANAAADRLLPAEADRNVVRLVYGGAWRDAIDNWAEVAVAGLARLTAEAARHPGDEVLAGLVDLASDAVRHLSPRPRRRPVGCCARTSESVTTSCGPSPWSPISEEPRTSRSTSCGSS